MFSIEERRIRHVAYDCCQSVLVLVLAAAFVVFAAALVIFAAVLVVFAAAATWELLD